MQEYEISTYKKDDEEKLVNLLIDVFDGWPPFDLECTPLEHWRWKYLDNPHKTVIVATASINGQCIGCWHRIPQKLKFFEHIYLSSQGMDVAVHPKHRGKRVSSKLRDLAREISSGNNINFRFGVNTNPKIRKSSERRGFLELPLIHELIYVLRPKTFFYNIRQIYHKFKNYFSRIYRISEPHKRKTRESSFRIINTPNFDDRINEFWRQIKDHYDFIVVRDKEHLNWRYCDPRAGIYAIKLVEEDNDIVGYCVLRISKQGPNDLIGCIVDFLTLPERMDVAEALLTESIDYLKTVGVNVIKLWTIQNGRYYRIYVDKGFFKHTEAYINYLLSNNGIKLTKTEFESNDRIHFVYGDSDGI